MQPGNDTRIGIIGLGYVGLPLAAAFGAYFETVGFDIDTGRIDELAAGRDLDEHVGRVDGLPEPAYVDPRRLRVAGHCCQRLPGPGGVPHQQGGR